MQYKPMIIILMNLIANDLKSIQKKASAYGNGQIRIKTYIKHNKMPFSASIFINIYINCF